MRNLKKSWLLITTAFISAIAVSLVWQIWKKQRITMAASKPQLVVQLGHSAGISSAAFSPDGRFIVSGGANIHDDSSGHSDNTAILWETDTGREVRRFVGHTGSINSVAFSPNGHFVLTGGGFDCTARLWDVATGKEIRQFVGHKASVSSVAFSPDGQFALTGSGDTTVRIWSTTDGSEVHRFSEYGASVNSVAFSADGDFVLSGSSADARLWDVDTGKEIHRFVNLAPTPGIGSKKFDRSVNRRLTHEIGSVAFSPNGLFALTGDSPTETMGMRKIYTVRLWNTITGKEIRRFSGCGPVAFSPDGQKILTGGGEDSGIVQLWDVTTGKKIQEFSRQPSHIESEESLVKSVSFSPNGDSILVVLGEMFGGGNSGGYGGVVALRLYSLVSGTQVRSFESNTSASAGDLAFSPTGNYFFSGKGIWDVRTGSEVQFDDYSFDDLSSSPEYIVVAPRVFSSDERFVLTPHQSTEGYGSESIHLTETASGKTIFKLSGFEFISRAWFSANNRRIFIFGETHRTDSLQTRDLYCWDIETKRQVWHFNVRRDSFTHIGFNNPGANTDCTLSPDGRFLAVRGVYEARPTYIGSIDGSGRTILLDADTGRVIRSIKSSFGAYGQVEMLAFSPDSRFLLTSSNADGSSLSLYEVETGKEVKRFQNVSDSETAVAFSPDGRWLLTGRLRNDSDQFVQLWDVASGKEAQRFSNQSSKYTTFSPSSRFLLTTDNQDGKIVHMWEVMTGQEVRRFEGHTDNVTSIAVSPDSRFVLTSSADHTGRLWDISSGEELCRLVSLLNGNWIAATPDGRFDTNNLEDIKGLHWIVSDDPLKPLSLEIFMRQYYEPRLLARVLAGESLKPLPSLAKLNRTQPDVEIIDITPDSTETVQVTVEVANAKSEIQQNWLGISLESGVYDVRLFRDRQLVGYAPANDGEVKLNKGGTATLRFPYIKMPYTNVDQVEFSAYAFNADRIKSATNRKSYTFASKPTPIRGRAYVISLGVNAYEREGLNLRYAANDARQVQENLVSKFALQGEYEEVVGLPLVSDYFVTLADGRTYKAQDATLQEVRNGQKHITENTTTKAHVRAVLDMLAGRQVNVNLLEEIPNADKLRAARPEDLVIFSVSSHGYADSDGSFYIVPSDTGTDSVSSPEFRRHCISSDELSHWLRDVDAGELVLIVDACHSTAAVEGTDFKPGPMGSRGLGQLSYDKGMRILTATQADNVALEANQVRQGLLIYALLQEGLGAWKADYKPQDKNIMLAEWLSYGVERVPRLYDAVKTGQAQISDEGKSASGAARFIRDTVDPRETDNDKTQQPSLFDFARRRDLILARNP